MAYSPIAFTAANYRDYKFNWLKAYEPGTTTPKVMATDSTLGTLIAKAEINIDGFIISAGGALITPYIDGSYDLYVFPTGAEADANDTSSALRLADNITGSSEAIVSGDAAVTSAFIAADVVVTDAFIAADVVITDAFVAADAVVAATLASDTGASLVGSSSGSTVQQEITALQAGQTGGVIVFATYALLDAYTPAVDEQNSSFKVTNDPTSNLNGYYSWVSGTTYTKDASLVVNVIDPNNTSDGVSGFAVYRETKYKTNSLIGNNKFNYLDEDIASGYSIDSATGDLTVNASYSVSDYIPIIASSDYHFSEQTSLVIRRFAFYNISGGFISGGYLSNITSPAGAVYLRVAFANSFLSSSQVAEGLTFTPYENYKEFISADNIRQASILSDKLSRSAVSTIKTDFIQVGKNIFNTADAGVQLLHSINYVDGTTYTHNSFNVTGFMPVEASTEYFVQPYLRKVVYFDINKVYISGIEYSGPYSEGAVTTPANCAFVRTAVLIGASWDNYQIALGSAQSTYKEYRLEIITPEGIPINLAAGAEGLDDGEVSTIKTDFIQVGKNIFNANDLDVQLLHSISLGDGTTYTNNSFNVTGFIPVLESTQYFVQPYLRKIVYFDVNKVYISGIEYGSPSSAAAVTTPAGCAFVRTAVLIGVDWDTYQIALGNSQSIYQEYKLEFLTPEGLSIYPVSANTSVQLALSPKQYVPVGYEIAIYNENIIRDYRNYKGQSEITFNGAKITSPSSKATFSAGSADTTLAANVSLVDTEFAEVESLDFNIEITNDTNTTSVVIQNIGSSSTARSTWVDVINASSASANITYVGNRTSSSATPSVRCEGQGGWTVNSYFTVDYQNNLSPFMQPVNVSYLYFGMTSFWIDANSATPSYNAADFDTVKDGFNAITGFKTSPNVNDVMSDGGAYVYWTGSAWAAIDISVFGGFAFNYAQYRSAWSIASPDVVHVLLGSNTFANGYSSSFEGTYAAFKSQYDQMFASILADNANTKIIISLTYSSGRQGEYGVISTEKRKLGYHSLAVNLIRDYGNREVDGYYLLDCHAILDRVYGFDRVYEQPFSGYTGALADGDYASDTTHASVQGFYQMGAVYMGLIQHIRSI